ncbi:uncharacterized protein YegL [Breznakia sp. PF5-3]|uniref:vWA domain-containing protein n=1 Tax=unclassified Breznakia TaxID=2623764 RepID=UPI002405D8FC|nr:MULTISPECIES: vWA domain-containing protein [unclassified Breznakia]MDF9823995.1 uncharacterized protein YegL [Breznakia sp. PM6-1]MDF9834794.1 uncharacterized protein YegL [Breznakia sp. PF5-3]MDF9838061.1 uncharacterized protein YegL [Breznakia sp. PFB2-8]MDF9860047.1 uncharacterized protein YegL [Breznakia sp. PH5-24]
MKKLKIILCTFVFMTCMIATGSLMHINASTDPGIRVNTKISNTVVAGTDDTYTMTLDITGGKTSEIGVTKEPIDVILLLDTSASMNGAPLNEAKASSKAFVEELLADTNANIRVSVIGFGGGIRIPGGSGEVFPNAITYMNFTNDKSALLAAIDGITITGTTALKDGIEEANQQFSTNSMNDHRKILLLLGDGAPQDGITEDSLYVNQCYDAMETLVNTNPNVTVNTIGYNLESFVELTKEIWMNLAAIDRNTGKFYNSSTDDLSAVFNSIYTDLFTLIDYVHVNATIPEGFEIVPNSLSNPNGLQVDTNKLANNELDIITGALGETTTVSLSYQIRIKQNTKNLNANTIPYSFSYQYTNSSGAQYGNTTQSVKAPIYKISTVADNNGSISTSRLVGKGATHEVRWQANDGYILSSFNVNGTNINITNNNSYILSNINENKNVNVYFEKKPIKTPSIVPDDSDNIIVNVEGVNKSIATYDTTNTSLLISLLLLAGYTLLICKSRLKKMK